MFQGLSGRVCKIYMLADKISLNQSGRLHALFLFPIRQILFLALAGVLAHEIGHVLKKHHLNAVKASGWTGIASELVSAQTGGNPHVSEFVKNAMLKVFASGLDQADEFEADRLGVVIAARAGYDPFGLPAVLQVLQGESSQDSAFALMFKTHPAPAERIGRLDALIQRRFDDLPANQGKPFRDRLKEFGK
jgi:beta-barrel assembly-enhancing protease